MSAPRVAIVTGGTHGIGRATVEMLTARGVRVVFSGRDAAAGVEVERAVPGSVHVGGDICDDAVVARLVDTARDLGGGVIAGLVNCAGIGGRQDFAKATLADWDRIFAVNARAAFAVTAAAHAALSASGHGSVVFVSSVAGYGGEAGLAIYCASKAALIGLAKAMALEIGDRVRVNVVCPGQVDTRMMARTLADPAKKAALEARIPNGRIAKPEEVAAAIVWLLSDEASYVNGVVIPIDGGEVAGLRDVPMSGAAAGR
ncbi:SDR family oxidoreductase [Pseudoxanthobacter sp. M-2]|uniref:SDR family NAD(P)-dependent oxidoreductase n=1 Tax=Pseudoxanthobacter sp. M-2 TaxID=3078754 RepID=UPI0038FC8F1C